MKKHLTVVLTMLLAFVLCFSFVGCKNDNRGMTQEKWEAAFEKSGTFYNRTESTEMLLSIDLKYNGESVTDETDLGEGMTGADLFEALDIEGLGTMGMQMNYLYDVDNGKVNAVSTTIFGDQSESRTEFYRLDGAKIVNSYKYSDAYKYIYGPYKDADTAKGLLVKLSDVKGTLSGLKLTTEDGEPLSVVKDFDKLTFSNGAYGAKVSMDLSMFDVPLVGNGTGKVTVTKDYVSSVKLDLKNSATLESLFPGEEVPAGVTFEVALNAEIKVTNVGNTTVSDDGIVDATENNTYENPVVTTAEQFENMFPKVEDGFKLELYDHSSDSFAYYNFEIKKTADGYDAYLSDGVGEDAKYYFYIVNADGIMKYERQVEDGSQNWGEPSEVSTTGTLDALIELMPNIVKKYFAKYDDGKTLPELFDKFDYENFKDLVTVLNGADGSMEVSIYFNYNGEYLSLGSIYLDDDTIYVSDYIGNLEYNRPDAE